MKTQGLSLAEQFIAEGEAKGLEQGIEQGRHLSLVTTLERLLARRFGELPEDIQCRLKSASIPELENLTDAILDAQSLHELFPPTPSYAKASEGMPSELPGPPTL